jgi:uncharacterized lipoprotein YajG
LGLTLISYLTKIPLEYQDEELRIMAVSAHGDILQNIDEEFQTEKVCKAAIKNNPKSIKHVINQTPELCILAVSLDKEVMKYIDLNIFE